MRFALLIFVLSIWIVNNSIIQNGCTTKQNKISIYPTTNEILTWQIKQEFFNGADLTYTLSDDQQKEFQIIHPIEQTKRDSSHKNVATNIVAAKVASIQESGFWLNLFVFLDQTENEVYINIANSIEINKSPNFNQRYLVTQRNDSSITCFDVDFSSNQQYYIVDCQKKIVQQNETNIENIFFILSNDGTKIQSFTEKAFYQIYKQRSLGQYVVTNSIGVTHQYLFRFTPAYSIRLDSELSDDSLVEVYLMSETGEPQNTNFVLDKIVLADALGYPSVNFSLVDYSVQPNGDIYLLDAYNGLYIVNYMPNGEWKIQHIVNQKTGQSFAFSVNSFIKEDETLAHFIVVQGYNYFVLFENLEPKYIYDLPFIQLEYPSYIKLSQENVILRNEHTIYLYNIDTQNVQLNSRFTLSQKDVILLNPYLPDLVVISNLLTKRYTLSMGYLKYMGSTEAKAQKDIMLIAQAPNEQKCTVTISYQILNDRDPQIYKLSDSINPFPKTLLEGSTQKELQPQASGPNQQFEILKNEQEDDTQITGIINKRWILKSNIVWPTKVLFADVLVLEKQSQFCQIIQSEDLIVQFWLCEQQSIFESNFNCVKMYSQKLEVPVTKQTFSIWIHDLKNIYFMYRDTDFSLIIKYFNGGESKTWKQLSYDKKNPLNAIKSLFFAENYFFVMKEDDTIIAYLTYTHDNEILATIDAQTFKPYGYTLKWKPQRFFGNRKLHPNLIFIVNQNNIVLVDFHNKFTFLQQYQFESLEVELAIGENTFFIVYGQTTQGANDAKIEEYDFSRLNNIFKTKTVQLYWYQITSPLTVDQSEENGRLFIRAYCKYSKKPQILVFTPDTLQHDSLYDAWSITNENITDNDKVIMAVDGDQQMFLYIFVKGQTTQISELKTSVMQLKLNLEAQNYNTKINLILSVSNYKFPDEPFNTIEIKKQVQLINTQSQIQIDNSIFQLSKTGVMINSNVHSRRVDLGSGWFTGQVVGIDLECEQCENHISVQNILELNNQKIFNGFEIRDLVNYDDSTNIFVATKGLIFTNLDNTLKAVYHFDLPTATYRCYQAQVSADKLLIYALCEDKGQYSIYVTGCISVTGCSPLGEKFKLEQASKVQLIDNDIMVVLHTNNLEYSDVDGRIVIYQIKKGLLNWNLEVLDVIATETLNSQLTSPLEYFRPSDFTIIKQFTTETQSTLYKLIISNSKNGLIFYDFELSNFRYQFQSVESLDLYQYLNYEVDQYAFENTHFLQIKLTEQPKYNQTDQSISLQLLVQTSNAAHYGISFQFKKLIDSQYTKIQSKQIDFVLNRYSNWPSINKIAVNSNYIAIPYINGNSLLIALYQKSIFSPITIISGTYLQYYQEQFISILNMALFFDPSQQNLLYASEQVGPLKSYALQSSPIIIFNNKNGDLKSQTVIVILQNNFHIEKTQFELQINPVEKNECTAKVTNIKIYPSTTEVLQWQLSNGLFEGVGLQYSIDDNQDFTIIQPINKINSKQHMTTAIGTVQSIKAQNSDNSWNGHFAFLDKSAISNGLYYTKTQAQKNEAPHFTDMVHIDPELPSVSCFDFDYTSIETTTFDHFLIDCQYQSQKIIYLIQGKKLKAISKIESQFTVNNLRWFNKFHNNLAQFYFVRITPAFSNSQGNVVGKVSLVEVFLLNDQEIILKSTIDNTLLAQLLKKEKTDFILVDYKVYNNGILFLLDQKLGLLKLQFDFKSQKWELLDQLHVNLQQFIAFDVDDYTNEQGQVVQQIVLLSYNYFLVLENKVIIKVRDLEYFTATYPQHIELKKKNVFIQNDNTLFIYGFNDQSVTLLDQSFLKGGYLIDKIEKQYITIDSKEAILNHFSQGALKYECKSGQVKEGEIKIQASSISNQKCQSNIKYSIIKSDDQTIYKKTDSETPFPNAVDETISIELKDLTSGPNQQYGVMWEVPEVNGLITDQIIDNQVRILQNSIYSTQGLPITILYQASIITPNKFIYKIIQQKDKKLSVFYSIINDDPEPKLYKFSQIGQNIDVQIELNDQMFTVWNRENNDVVFFATLLNQHQLNIYRIFQSASIELIKSFPFPEEDDQTIISILNQGNTLFILQKKNLIQLNIEDLKLDNGISETQLREHNFEWNPVKLFGNRILKSNILFVQNEKSILIINYVDKNFIYLQSIEYTANNQIYISAAKNTFFLVNNKEIFEYNYENLLNIYKSKTVELFGYEITNPLLVTTQLSTGNLIIKSTKNEHNYLNILKPSQTQHDTFYATYELDTIDPVLSVANDDAMFISLNNALLSFILKVEQTPYLVFNPKFDEKNYMKNIKVTLVVRNKDDEKNEVKFIQTLKFFNSFSQLSLTNVNFSIQTNSTKTVEFPVEEAIGQNIQTILKPFNETQGLISLKSRVQLIKNKNLSDYYVRYGYSKNEKEQQSFLIYLQAKNTLVIGVNFEDNIVLIPAEYTLPDQYNCFRLDNYQNRFYSICNNGNENELVVSDCENKKCKLIKSYIPIPNGNQVIAPYENHIIVLFYNPSSPQDQDGEFKVYKVINEDAFYIQKEVMTINLEFIQKNINSKATNYRPSSMTGVGVQIDKDLYVYLLMVTNCLDELMFNNFAFQQGDIQPVGISSISLKKLLNNYIGDQTLFLSTQVIFSTFENDVLTVELVILTSDSGSFQIMLKFKYNKEKKKFEIDKSELIRAFVKYGNWKALNYLTVDKSSIAVAYYNQNQVTVGVYQYTKESTFVLMSGGYQFEVSNLQDLSPQAFLMLLQSNYLFGSNPNNKGLEKYQLNQNNLIIIQEPQKQQNQTLTLTFSNDFSKIQENFELQIIPNNNDDDDDGSKGLAAVWIVLIVLGSLVCLGLIGYGYYKAKGHKVEEEEGQLV